MSDSITKTNARDCLVLDHVARFLSAVPGATLCEPAPSASANEEHWEATLWNLRKLFRELMSDGFDEEWAQLVPKLGERISLYEGLFVDWIRLIESLIQDAESRHQGKSNRGKVKAAEVKAVMRHLIRRETSKMGWPLQYVLPAVIDAAVDWCIEALILMLNQYGLWEERRGDSSQSEGILHPLERLVLKVLQLIIIPLAWLYFKLQQWQETRIALSPGLRAAVANLEAEFETLTPRQILSDAKSLVKWFVSHRKQLTAGIQLICSVVHEAELFTQMTGVEKKQYARDLVFAVFAELGFRHRSGLLFALADSLVQTAIEAVVSLFKKHRTFARTQETA